MPKQQELQILKEEGYIVALIKPQFECEPGETKKGIVRESSEHVRILKKTFDALYLTGIEIIGVTFSPIKGPKGNIEFLIYYRVPSGQFSDKPDFQIESLVASAHDSLNGVSDEDSDA